MPDIIASPPAYPARDQAPPARLLRLGVIAAEFPPEHGGMQEHARGLVECLSRDHHVTVYTSHGQGDDAGCSRATIRPVMRWQLSPDLHELERAPVDAWIALNAGLAPYGLGVSKPLFTYVHGNDFARPWYPRPTRAVRIGRRFCGAAIERRWRRRLIEAGLRSSRWMFANSAFSRGLCARMYGLAEERITVVPPGVRPEFFRHPAPFSRSQLRLVTVSRLTTEAARKNIDGVIEAVARLRGEIDVRYTVIGDGDDLPRLRALAASLGLTDTVRFLGPVDTARVIEEFARSDAFIMAVRPSHDDVEGFGMVYAEAAASGLPAIGTFAGGIPEVIEQDVTGLLLEDASAAGIADGLRRFRGRRSSFDREVIRSRAERFSAPCCSARIAETISARL